MFENMAKIKILSLWHLDPVNTLVTVHSHYRLLVLLHCVVCTWCHRDCALVERYLLQVYVSCLFKSCCLLAPVCMC
jgi:hypothetical protein